MEGKCDCVPVQSSLHGMSIVHLFVGMGCYLHLDGTERLEILYKFVVNVPLTPLFMIWNEHGNKLIISLCQSVVSVMRLE